jgi:hypothetical protein
MLPRAQPAARNNMNRAVLHREKGTNSTYKISTVHFGRLRTVSPSFESAGSVSSLVCSLSPLAPTPSRRKTVQAKWAQNLTSYVSMNVRTDCDESASSAEARRCSWSKYCGKFVAFHYGIVWTENEHAEREVSSTEISLIEMFQLREPWPPIELLEGLTWFSMSTAKSRVKGFLAPETSPSTPNAYMNLQTSPSQDKTQLWLLSFPQ